MATLRAPTLPGALRAERVTAVGVTVPQCAQKRVGDRTGTLLLSPDLVPSCPGPVLRGSRSWRYFCCLARIRSILEAQDAAQPAPPGVPHMRGCPKVHGERSQCPPKPTHCRFSWSSDFFSARRCAFRLFMMLALNSATPLRDRGQGKVRGTPSTHEIPQNPNPTWKPAGKRLGGST